VEATESPRPAAAIRLPTRSRCGGWPAHRLAEGRTAATPPGSVGVTWLSAAPPPARALRTDLAIDARAAPPPRSRRPVWSRPGRIVVTMSGGVDSAALTSQTIASG
jgi:hypothetical protein